MDLESSESGVPQSSFLDLSDVKPGVPSQLNQTGTFFKRWWMILYRDLSLSPTSSPASWLMPSVCCHCCGRCARWSGRPPRTWAPAQQLVFYFCFPRQAEQGFFGFPAPTGAFLKAPSVLCVWRQGWWGPGESGSVLLEAAVPKQYVYRVIVCPLWE